MSTMSNDLEDRLSDIILSLSDMIFQDNPNGPYERHCRGCCAYETVDGKHQTITPIEHDDDCALEALKRIQAQLTRVEGSTHDLYYLKEPSGVSPSSPST